MTLKATLLGLTRAIVEEAERNAPFRQSLEAVLDSKVRRKPSEQSRSSGRHRRPDAKVDPIELAKEGKDIRSALLVLDIEELKDIVAEFGMDPSKLVMKWKDAQKIIEHIIETSISRASKGDAFKK